MRNIVFTLVFFMITHPIPSVSQTDTLWEHYDTGKILNMYRNNISQIIISYDNIKYFGFGMTGGNILIYNGENWLKLNFGNPFTIDNNNIIWKGDYGSIYKYDGFESIKYSIHSEHPEWKIGYIVSSLIFDDLNILWITFRGDREWYTGVVSFDGVNFTRHLSFADTNHHMAKLKKDSLNNIWVTSTKGLYYYDRNNWKAYTIEDGLPKNFCGAIAIDHNNTKWIGLGILTSENYGLVSFDGTTWIWYTAENSGLPDNKVQSIAVDQNNRIWIGTYSGVSRFDGETWTTFTTENSGLADNKVNAIAVEKNNTIWFGTDNGVSKYTGEVITTLVDEEETKPEALPLIRAYPNPFNPTTTIEFELPETGMAALTIYNIAGQKVRELLNSYQSAGKHRIVWDGTDESGNAVSAGVYIARLKVGEVVGTGKMVLVR